MAYEQTSRSVRNALRQVFAEVDTWFDCNATIRAFRPASGGWSIDLVLEHISLTNRFLLLTLRKYTAIAERRSRRGDALPGGESDLSRLDLIGERGSFPWPRPEHMEPTGLPTSEAVRATLEAQRNECLALLDRLDGGIGSLCQITMTVKGLGKIDLYQWLYFLAQHARRHLQQMAAIEAAFRSEGPGPV